MVGDREESDRLLPVISKQFTYSVCACNSNLVVVGGCKGTCFSDICRLTSFINSRIAASKAYQESSDVSVRCECKMDTCRKEKKTFKIFNFFSEVLQCSDLRVQSSEFHVMPAKEALLSIEMKHTCNKNNYVDVTKPCEWRNQSSIKPSVINLSTFSIQTSKIGYSK